MSHFESKVSSLGWLVIMVGTMEFPVFKLNMEQEDEWHDAVKFLARAVPANLPTKSDTVLYYRDIDRRGERQYNEPEKFEVHTIDISDYFLNMITIENPGNSSPLVLSIKKLREYFGQSDEGMLMSLYAAKTIVETLAVYHFLPLSHLGSIDKLKEYPKTVCRIEYQGNPLI